MKPPSAVAATTLCLLILAGCTPTPSPTSPTPSPSPTYWCTPEAGGTSHRCNEADYRAMQANDKLYAEAEAVYRKFFAEDEHIYRTGGVSKPTPVLEETTSGEFLEDSMAIYGALKTSGTRLVGGVYRIAWLKRVPNRVKGGSVVAMQSCTDAHSAHLVSKGSANEPAGYGSDLLFFGRSPDGALKVQSAEGDVVKSC